jgi:hypothetical protein
MVKVLLKQKKRAEGRKKRMEKNKLKNGNSRQDLPGTMYGGGSSPPL